jgi:hypothetical protein
MSQPLLRAVLRGVAITIAVAALVDPMLSIERAPAVPLTLIKMTAADVSPIVRELQRVNAGTQVRVREVAQHRVPCGPGDRCVVMADGTVDAALPADLDQPLSLITIGAGAGPNVRLRSVVLAAGQHAGAAGVARVLVAGREVVGRRTEIQVSDNAAIVGTASVEWQSDGLQVVDVPWWPLAPGPRSLRIEAIPATGESAVFDNVLTAGVDVGSERLPVLVFDARPSWGSTFVRRALEDDARFLVEHRARLAPAITSGTANGRLETRALDAASVLVVGGPDALTASEVDLIVRFVRVRGGTAVLLPERAPSGTAARLFAGEWSEQLISEPRDVGSLKASELLVAAGATGAPGAVVIVPTGSGRLVISTAMDAWRYRADDNGAFDRFWRSVAAEGAAAGAALRLEFEDNMAIPGSRQALTVRYRSMQAPSTMEASAVARCGPPSRPSAADSPSAGGLPSRPSTGSSSPAASADRAETIRLWPAGAPGVLRGELPIGDGNACTVEATVNDATVTRGIAVSRAPSRPVAETLAKLERHARASGGVVIRLRPSGATARQALEEVLQATSRPAVQTKLDVYPMRSPFWLLPFAGLLSVEWWLRRRRGLR